MSKEFEIVSRIDLSTDDAMKKWQSFKKETQELKEIDIKVKISNISSIESELKGLLKLSSQISESFSKATSLKVESSGIKEQTEALEKYKDTYRTIQKLQQQQSKATNSTSFNRIGNDIDELQSKLKSLESNIKNSDVKLELFNFKQQNADLVKFESTLTGLTSKAEKLQTSFNSVDFKNVNTSVLEGDITQLMSKIEQLQVLGRQGVDVKVDLNNALNEVERLKTVLSNFGELDKIKSNFMSLENSMQDALGTEHVDKLRGELEQLESSVMQVDGSFDRLASGVSGSLKSASSSISSMNNSLKNSNKFMSDFTGSFYAFTAGNIIGDGIVSGIRGIKDAFMEMDAAMTNVKKVANDTDTNTEAKLDNIRNKSIEIAKAVGQSSSDTLNAIADTVQAGVSKTIEGSMEIAKQAMMFGNVGELNQEMASSMVNTMIRGFNIDPVTKFQKEVNGAKQEVTGLTTGMDALNYASNNYGTSAEQLANGIQNGGNVLGAYGVTLNDTVALITAGVEVLGDGNKIGNGLKSIGINLAGMKTNAKSGTLELNKTAKSLKEIAGIDVYSDKSKGQVKDMVTILDEVQGKWKGLREDEQLALSEAIAGKQQSAVFQSIMTNYEQFKKLQGELSQDMHLGSMEAENSKYVDSISGKLNQLKETWISIGTTIVSSDFTKGLLDGAIKVSEAIDKVIKSLDGMGALTPVITGFGASFVSMMKSISGGNGSNFGVTKQVTTLTNGFKQATAEGKKFSVIKSVFSSVGGSIVSAGKYLGSFLLQGAAIAGVTFLVSKLAEAWDNATNGLKNAEKEIKTSIQDINGSIKSDREELTFLENTTDRYNELINKKKEYSKTPVDNWTEEQISDMEELKGITSELAEMFPELVMGYDSSGSPILLMADDMEKLKSRTEEQLKLNQELLKIEREKLAINSRKQVQEGEFFGKSMNEEIASLEKGMKDGVGLYEHYQGLYLNQIKLGNTKRAEGYAEDMKNQSKILEENYNKRLKLFSDYSEKELQLQQVAYDQIQAMRGFEGLKEDDLSQVQGFIDNINWAGMDESQYNKWVNSFDEIIKLAGEGSPKIEEWNKALSNANDKYAATENVQAYRKDLEGLAKTISEDLNLDYDTVFSGLEGMTKPLTQAQISLNSFLESFGKTRFDLLNGDSIAEGLAEQFQAVQDTIKKLTENPEYAYKKVDGQLILTYNAMIDIANKDGIPKQIQDLASEFAKDGVLKSESDMILEIMASINTGDKDAIEKTISDINAQLVEMGQEEHVIDIKTLFDTDALEQAGNLEDALNRLRKEKVTTNVDIQVDGQDKAQLYLDIINGLKTNSELTNRFILENQDALSQLESYEEVVLWLQQNPDIVTKYNIQGIEALDEAEKKKEKLETEGEAKTSVNVVTDGEKELIELKATIEDTEGEKEVKVTVDNEDVLSSIKDVETLVKMSSEVEDGKYKLDIEANTEQAVANLGTLEDGLKNLSTQMSSMKQAVISIVTAQAAKNISGLITRISQVKSAIDGIKGKTINIITALAAKNLSGLIVRVNQYIEAIGKVKDKTVNVLTATAAKNLSGLMTRVDQYNGKVIPTKTVNVNVSNAISQLNTLLSKFNALPSSKTVNVKVSSSGGASQGVKTYSTPVEPQMMAMDSQISTMADINSQVSTLDDANSQISTMSWGNPVEALKYGYDTFIELENALKRISSQLEILDKKADKAFGSEKISYLRQQLDLLRQQANEQNNLVNSMTTQQQKLKSYLSGKGFNFDAIGNLTNYHTKLIGMERELEKLETNANKTNASDSTKKKAEDYKNSLDEIKKVMGEYIDITFNDLPNAKEQWEELNYSVQDVNDEIKKMLDNQRALVDEAKVESLKDAYSDLEHELSLIDKRMNNASDKEKLELLSQQLVLIQQQQDEIKKQKDELNSQKSVLQNQLRDFGFSFDQDGDVSNYANQLQKIFDSGRNIEEAKDILEKYFDLQNDELPSLEKDWLDNVNAIQDAKDEINEIREAQNKLIEEARVHTLKDAYKDLNNELDILDKKMDDAVGLEKIGFLEKEIELLKQKEAEIKKQQQYYDGLKNNLQDQLKGFGFAFDKDGDITNYSQQLQNIFNSGGDIEKAKDILEEYFKIQDDKLPDLESQWWDTNNAIKDSSKEIEEEVTKILKDEVEKRKKLIDEELDKKLDALDKQKKAYNDAREKADYEKDYDKQLTAVTDIQKQIELAKRDTSLSGQKKLQDLLKQLASEQEKLQDMVQDNIDKSVNDMFDSEKDRLEEQADKEKESLDEWLSEDNIKKAVQEALMSDSLEDSLASMGDVGKGIVGLKDTFATEMSNIGSSIQDGLLDKLNNAKSVFSEISSIMNDFDSSSMSRAINGSMLFTGANTPNVGGGVSNISFNQPLIVVEGDVNSEVMEDLKEFGDKLKSDIIKVIANSRM